MVDDNEEGVAGGLQSEIWEMGDLTLARGEFLGARQSGAPMLRFVDLVLDADWLAWAREVAPVMLDQHPELAHRHILRWLGGKAEFLKA